jgi:hypothetical protein
MIIRVKVHDRSVEWIPIPSEVLVFFLMYGAVTKNEAQLQQKIYQLNADDDNNVPLVLVNIYVAFKILVYISFFDNLNQFFGKYNNDYWQDSISR